MLTIDDDQESPVGSPPPLDGLFDIPDNQVIEVEADHIIDGLKDKTLFMPPEVEANWIPLTTNYPPQLVRILKFLYPQHRYASQFQWSVNQINAGKYI